MRDATRRIRTFAMVTAHLAVRAAFCCASLQSARINGIWPRGAQRGKCAIAAVGRAAAVGRHDPEMIRCAGSQAADVGSHVLIDVATFTSSSVSVGDKRAFGRYNQEALSRS